MGLAEQLVPRSYHLLAYDWTPLSQDPCWNATIFTSSDVPCIWIGPRAQHHMLHWLGCPKSDGPVVLKQISNDGRDKSFVDDLNMERGSVSMRVGFVLRSAEDLPLFLRFVFCASCTPPTHILPIIKHAGWHSPWYGSWIVHASARWFRQQGGNRPPTGIWIGGGVRAEDRGDNSMSGLRLGICSQFVCAQRGKSAQVARGLKNTLVVGWDNWWSVECTTSWGNASSTTSKGSACLALQNAYGLRTNSCFECYNIKLQVEHKKSVHMREE